MDNKNLVKANLANRQSSRTEANTPLAVQPSSVAFHRLAHVFVYGTLKRGQCREDCWPVTPVYVESAWALGSLWDLGPYPALLRGHDRVKGELWSFELGDVPHVLAVLDQIEVTNQPGLPNEYDRVPWRVTGWTQGPLVASTYRYADSSIANLLKPMVAGVFIDGQRFVEWPTHS